MENPKPSKGSYKDWQDRKEPQTNKNKLQDMIDSHISAGMVFEQFIAAMHGAGCEVKRGKYLAFKIPGAERFTRVKSIGDDYTEEALRERCLGKRIVAPRRNSGDDSGRKAAEYAAAVNSKIVRNFSSTFKKNSNWRTVRDLNTTPKFIILKKLQKR